MNPELKEVIMWGWFLAFLAVLCLGGVVVSLMVFCLIGLRKDKESSERIDWLYGPSLVGGLLLFLLLVCTWHSVIRLLNPEVFIK